MIRKLLKKLRRSALKPNFMNMQIPNSPTSEPTAFVAWNNSTGFDNVKSAQNEDTRLEKKPIEVVVEIVSEIPQMDLTDLDNKIKIVAKRLKCFTRLSCSGSDEAFALRFLKSRKLFKKYYTKFNWKITTQQKIQELVKKYKVQCVFLSGYYKSLPMEAITELERFMDAWELVCEDIQPNFQLIIDYGGKEQKKDPILLASSPFGNWYYILGAWDKEVEIVDDLIYKGK